jgi:catechol 2,3-dioxygenase-like lactoylglutathione lyase family enzyme
VSQPSPSPLCGAATGFVVRDVLRSVEYFRDALGFHTEFTYGEPTFYAGVERDGVIIHLQAASETKRQPGHGAVNVFVTDVEALYRELTSRGARTLNEPKDYPYGMRDFDVHDLDGNHLCFGMESKK